MYKESQMDFHTWKRQTIVKPQNILIEFENTIMTLNNVFQSTYRSPPHRVRTSQKRATIEQFTSKYQMGNQVFFSNTLYMLDVSIVVFN
jgi:hypothetical protein